MQAKGKNMIDETILAQDGDETPQEPQAQDEGQQPQAQDATPDEGSEQN